MTPEELAKLRSINIRCMSTTMGDYIIDSLPRILAHIDSQAEEIKQLQKQMENITRSRDNYYAEILRLEKAREESEISWVEEIANQNGQISRLKDTLIEARAKAIYPFNIPMWEHVPEDDCYVDNILFGRCKQTGKNTYRYHARQQLAVEMPEIDWEDKQ